jgi:hypothetical protein
VSRTGQQSFKVNLPLNETTHNPNVAVYIDGIARKNGDGWQIQKDETETWLAVNSAKSNVSIHTWNEYTAGPFGMYAEVDYSLLAVILALILCLVIGILILIRKRSRKTVIRMAGQEFPGNNTLL